MFPIIGIIVSLPIIAFGIFGFIYSGFTDGYDERAIGEVTRIYPIDDNNYCAFSYTFKVGSEIYSGNGAEYGSNCSILKVGTKITVAYNSDDPQFNSSKYDKGADLGMVFFFEILGFGILTACIARLYYIHRNLDTTGDGIGDNMPATDEQMKTIENGMRELGQFYAIPKKRLSHEQAKQAIDNINKQIAAMKKHR